MYNLYWYFNLKLHAKITNKILNFIVINLTTIKVMKSKNYAKRI